jgi:hypothetical protein
MGAPTRIRTSDSLIGDSSRPTGETAEPEGTDRDRFSAFVSIFREF